MYHSVGGAGTTKTLLAIEGCRRVALPPSQTKAQYRNRLTQRTAVHFILYSQVTDSLLCTFNFSWM